MKRLVQIDIQFFPFHSLLLFECHLTSLLIMSKYAEDFFDLMLTKISLEKIFSFFFSSMMCKKKLPFTVQNLRQFILIVNKKCAQEIIYDVQSFVLLLFINGQLDCFVFFFIIEIDSFPFFDRIQ